MKPEGRASATIDLRSDTVTRPCAKMREAMASAEVGDDVFGEDPTVARLEAHAARLLGKEAALFLPSGTMGNQIAIKLHTQPGQEVLFGAGGHTYRFESGGAALISGVQLTPIGAEIHFSVEDVASALQPDVYYCPQTRLVLIENACGTGRLFPYEDIVAISEFARERGLAMHLDGARLFNAVVASGIPAADFARHFDTVTFCISKGLGAPVGSLLCATKERIEEARRYRRALGGAMRQAGILAAAGLHALEHHIEDLALDHEKARTFAQVLATSPALRVLESETNIVFFDLDAGATIDATTLCSDLSREGILMMALDPRRVRAVMHRDVTPEEVLRAARAVVERLG